MYSADPLADIVSHRVTITLDVDAPRQAVPHDLLAAALVFLQALQEDTDPREVARYVNCESHDHG